jgi:stromal membrane-associated protein
MNDAFASLSFSQPTQQAPKPSPFAGLDNGLRSSRVVAALKPASSFAGGGSFFDAPTSPPPQAKPAQIARQPSLGGFKDFMSPAPTAKSTPAPAQSNDLFDLMSGQPAPALAPAPAPAPTPTYAPQPAASKSSYNNSAFNLSQPAPAQQPAAPAPSATKSPVINLTSNFDGWGSSNAWNDAPAKPTTSTSTATATASSDFGWGSSNSGFGQSKAAPQVSGDEDFGEWGHASPVATTTTSQSAPPKPASGFNSTNDDLFSNVWQ